jgi:hypothetical protein
MSSRIILIRYLVKSPGGGKARIGATSAAELGIAVSDSSARPDIQSDADLPAALAGESWRR